MKSALILFGFLLVTFCAPALGAFSTPDQWYWTIEKPSWNPPGWVFGPVWTFLYITMAVAAWLIWKNQGWSKAVGLYGIQLVFNAAWTPVFFGAHQIGWALVVIMGLWLAAMLTTVAFFRVSRCAGFLMVPYMVWLSFATILNFTLWQLNG